MHALRVLIFILFLYPKGKTDRYQTGLDTYLIRIQTRTPLSRHPPYDYSSLAESFAPVIFWAVLRKSGFGECAFVPVFVPSFRFFVLLFRFPGHTALCTLIPVFGVQEHPPKPPFREPLTPTRPQSTLRSTSLSTPISRSKLRSNVQVSPYEHCCGRSGDGRTVNRRTYKSKGF